MKIRHKIAQQQGMALVTVLMLVVFLSILIISLLALSRRHLRSSNTKQTVVNLDSLRDSAVNLAISQTRSATTQENELWASQPGAIRTFETDGGNPAKIFKLYSDEEMVEEYSKGNANLENDLVADWDSYPNVYANLNAPKTNAGGERSFPIVNPFAFDGKSATSSSLTPEGFSYEDSINGVFLPGSDGQLLPMPVKWIYILKDGSMGTLDNSGTFVPFSNQSDASRSNPISGRIAFWTDDESQKININTASEAIPWDTPRCYTPEDLKYARNQPVLNEVQRFGGHPATTCLSSVLFPNRYLDPNTDASLFKAIYDITPRVHYDGGILAGSTTRVTPDPDRLYVSVDELLFDGELQGNKRPIQFTGPFEDFPLEQRRFFLTANSNSPEVNPDGKPRVGLWPIHFNESTTSPYRTSYDNIIQFATTLGEVGVDSPFSYQRSRVQSQEGEWEAVHGMDARSARQNQELVRYLARSLGFDDSSGGASSQPIPGYSANFFDKYGVRNMAYNSFNFLDYIRTVNLVDDTKIDADGDGSLDRRVTPWTKGFNHNGGWRVGTANSQYLHTSRSDNGGVLTPQVTRLLQSFRVGPGHGVWSIARRFALNEVALVFCGVVEKRGDGSFYPVSLKDLGEQLNLQSGQMAIQVGFIPELTCPSPGYPHMTPLNNFRMVNLKNLRVNGTPAKKVEVSQDGNGNEVITISTWTDPGSYGATSLPFAQPNGPIPTNDFYRMWNGSGIGGTSDYRTMLGGRNSSGVSGMKDGYFIIDTNTEKMTVSTAGTGFNCGVQHLSRGIDGGSGSFWQANKITESEIPTPKIPKTEDLRTKWSDRMVYIFDTMKNGPDEEPDILDENDVIRSFVVCHGDNRLSVINGHIGYARGDAAARLENPLVQHPDWDSDKRHVHTLYRKGQPLKIGDSELASTIPLVTAVNYHPSIVPDRGVLYSDTANFKKTIDGGSRAPYPYSTDPNTTRDWSTGPGNLRDGGYSNFPDFGTHPTSGITPYFDTHFDYSLYQNAASTSGPEITKPNHIMPSAAMFGSLPSLAQDFIPWTSFLFRPELNAPHIGAIGRSRTSTGSSTLADRSSRSFPPDHMLLEYFWMPVIQPYAISEPFSTAGKVGMNYRMAPFSHITRATALHAVMKSERMLSIPTSAGPTYKTLPSGGEGWRNPVDAKKTLLQWEERFDNGDYFQTASELCEMFLVPQNKGVSGSTGSAIQTQMRTFWKAHQLTGDNVIERPYTNIYPRLTTKSNAYRVHYLVQTIQKPRDSDPTKMDSELDTITGEQQGDALIERYIDPQDPELVSGDYEFQTDPNAPPLDTLYQYRIRNMRRFRP